MASLSLGQIEEKLNSEFAGEGRRLVFWYDDKGEFADEIDSLQLKNAKIYRLTPNNQFRTKVLVEREDTQSNYLLYAPFAKPDVYSNHLEDTLLYSKRFYTDRISLLCADLGIDEALKPVLERYSKYFAARERVERFYNMTADSFDEKTIELALICCVCKTQALTFDEALSRILADEALEDSSYLQELAKYNLLTAFWQQCSEVFGYSFVDRSLEKLILSLWVTYADKYLACGVPQKWQQFLCNKQGSVVVFLDSFMNNVQYRARYDALSQLVGERLQADTALEALGAEAVLELDGFLACDKVIVQWLVEHLLREDLSASLNGKSIKEICSLRSRMHFADRMGSQYELCVSAYELIKTVNYRPEHGFNNILERYISDDWHIDYYYRQFYYAYDRLHNPSDFSRLQQLVENIYSNIYLARLLSAWNEEAAQVVTAKQLPLQRDFYNRYIKNERDRIVVIISDALRYEVAKELEQRLQQEERCREEALAVQLALPPTYTALGMAALLPHRQLSMDASSMVLVDGRRCASLDEREKILQVANASSVCIQFDDLKKMKRDELRAALARQQVVYIYHNQIDARGDAGKTEDEVFVACQEAVEEIYSMLCRLSVSASIVKFIVTADHGFIYQRHSIAESEKLSVVGNNALVNHRFIIGALPQENGTCAISLGAVLDGDDSRYVSYPKGAQIFKTTGGGTSYVHGGSSPQEMVVPVLCVRMDKGHIETKNAEIKLHTLLRKITSKDVNLVFVQTQAVSDTVKAAAYRVYFVDSFDRQISNECLLTADSTNSDIVQRTTTARFAFINGAYDPHAVYYLVIKAVNTDAEEERQEFIIDMS